MDVETGLTCSALTHTSLYADCVSGMAWTFQPPTVPNIRAMIVAELYRHVVNGQPTRKIRANGRGRADGLDGLARTYGVNAD